MSNLAEALPAEMARVRDEVLPLYLGIGGAGLPATSLMSIALDTAAEALASGDVVAMLKSYESLKGFKE